MGETKASLALALSEEIIDNLELSSIPLASICMKASRLARLLDDSTRQKYLTQAATYVNSKESEVETFKTQLSVANDPNISLSSSNPQQYLIEPTGNALERTQLTLGIGDRETELSKYRSAVYSYALETFHQLRFSGISSDFFDAIRVETDKKLSVLLPEATEKFLSVYDNLESQNAEDWSNAVHSCRRIIKAIADKLYPAIQGIDYLTKPDGKKIKVGTENYINRLMLYIESKKGCSTFHNIIDADLTFWGNRIDAIVNAASKGTHEVISSRYEAERYVIHTYLLLSDILNI